MVVVYLILTTRLDSTFRILMDMSERSEKIREESLWFGETEHPLFGRVMGCRRGSDVGCPGVVSSSHLLSGESRAWLDEHFGPSRFTWRTMVMSPYVLTTSVRETQVDRWTIMSSIAYGSRG